MIVTVNDDYDKEQGTDLPMFSRVGKTTVSMYIAFSQAAMNKHEEEEYIRQNPGADIEEFRNMKKNKRKKNNDGGLSNLQE
jgi:urease alpha subunit